MARLANARGTYLLVAESLRQQIEKGAYSAGALPSEADLCDAHQVSRNTIRRALKVLEVEALVESAPGIGWRLALGRDHTPLAERLIRLITDDSLSVGDAYPSESQLCARFSASRTAVRRALAQMEGAGLIESIQGKGRTVRALPGPPEQP
ncbi:winged helix-turn-helix domain-containing protein [Streptomyces sp. PvR006]|uniref:GntR family transcriptional regulator n=1 Tax=Streptomyces sp. PvR006 TaxID=2817860 RepID=UPI001AE477A6|nr:winged helix-turn-helix domain-containing protein [Streptomyces sp. PvR006]